MGTKWRLVCPKFPENFWSSAGLLFRGLTVWGVGLVTFILCSGSAVGFRKRWFAITSTLSETEPIPQQGFRLLRFHALSAGAPGVDADRVLVSLA